MIIRKVLSIGCIVTFFLLGFASTSSKNGTYSDVNNWMPKDFDPNTTLLIETHPLGAKQNEKMIKFLEENYPYRYEVVNRDIIESKTGKYPDIKKYHFAILWKSSTRSITSIDNGVMSDRNAWDMYGYFIDRATGKEYPSTEKRNVYGQTGYMPFFNSITKQYKK